MRSPRNPSQSFLARASAQPSTPLMVSGARSFFQLLHPVIRPDRMIRRLPAVAENASARNEFVASAQTIYRSSTELKIFLKHSSGVGYRFLLTVRPAEW